MKKQWLGITLAFGIGLTSSAWAAHSHHGTQVASGSVKSNKHLVHLENLQMMALAAAAPESKKASKTSITHSARLNAGIANFKRGYIAKSIPCFEQAVKQNPNDEMAYLWLARARQKQGTPADLNTAKAAYKRVLELNPNNQEALATLGEMLSWEPAAREEAIGLLQRACQLNPHNTQVSKTLSEALLWQGNPGEALKYAEPVARLFRNDKKWMGEYAQMLAGGGHPDEALNIYNTILKDSSGDQLLVLQLEQSRAFLKLGDRAEASVRYDHLTQAIAGKKIAKHPDFMQAMGSLAFDLDRYADALQWDQSLPTEYQRHKDIQLREVRSLTKLGRVPEAIDGFNRLYEAGLLTVDEKLEFAEYLRVQHLPAEGLPSANLVENLYQEAIRDAGGNPEVQLRLARYYADLGNHFDDALKAYQNAVADSNNPDSEAVKKEYLDFLKSDKSQAVRVESLFKEMMVAAPDDIQVKSAYAEFISWQKDRRIEALRLYAELGKTDVANREVWQAHIDEVLKWHVPTTDLIPLYQEIVNLYPQDKTVWMTVARAYRNDPDYYKDAVDTYGTLVQRFPDDGTIKREWLGLLLSNTSHRSENIAKLKKMTEQNPNDPDVLATYGKLLSYEHHYHPAMDAFEQALKISPNHRQALVGKGYVILWSGKKLEAKTYFQNLRKQFPDDVDVAIGLAQTEKLIGRYDQAMRIIQEIKPLMDKSGEKLPEASDATFMLSPEFQLVDNWNADDNLSRSKASYDFSILPYTNNEADNIPSFDAEKASTVNPMAEGKLAGYEPSTESLEEPANATPILSSDHIAAPVPGQDVPTVMLAVPDEVKSTSASAESSTDLNSLHAEIDALSNAINSLKQAQQQSRKQLDHLGETIRITKDAVPTEMTLQASDSETGSTPRLNTGGGSTGHHSVGESGMTKTYGVYNALDYDTNPLLSGVGRLKNDDLSNLEKGLTNDLRPMIRGGFLYTQRNGNATTTRLSSWGFPNQLSFSLTPQIRLRGGVSPTRYYLPQGKEPSSNWGTEYSLGGTVKYWDRLTLDGDFAITNFTQTQNVNVTYQAQAQYAFNDSIRFKLGANRIPQYNSLLSIAGQRPNQGFYRNQILGQARENGFFGELNTNPFNQNWDWNLGYTWAFVSGYHIPDNYKNQVFTSLGHKWQLGANHQLRLGYEFLYFGYSKNATSGYFDTTSAGFNVPVAKLDPVTLASSKFVYGGYYSPTFFMMNAGRLDLQGSLLNKMIEYKLGGSLGVQSANMGHNIHGGGKGSSLSSAFDSNVIFNMTDWLAAYGDVDYLNAGGQFNRWRFGGGFIVRPHIDALSPMLGKQKTPKTAAK